MLNYGCVEASASFKSSDTREDDMIHRNFLFLKGTIKINRQVLSMKICCRMVKNIIGKIKKEKTIGKKVLFYFRPK